MRAKIWQSKALSASLPEFFLHQSLISADIARSDVTSSKIALIFKFRASKRHYDVIIGNMEGFVTFLFIKLEGRNLADWGILMCTFQTIYF